MTKEQIYQNLRKIIKDVSGTDIDTIDKEEELMPVLGITSIEALQIYVLLEREFKIFIEDEELGSDFLKNISSLESYLALKMKEQGGQEGE